jgi:sortase (surface protein transpeptidase)
MWISWLNYARVAVVLFALVVFSTSAEIPGWAGPTHYFRLHAAEFARLPDAARNGVAVHGDWSSPAVDAALLAESAAAPVGDSDTSAGAVNTPAEDADSSAEEPISSAADADFRAGDDGSLAGNEDSRFVTRASRAAVAASSSGDEKANGIQLIESGIVPVRLEAPTIDLQTDVIEVGLLDDGQMEAPKAFDKVGWFAPGYKPGMQGNAVIAGHLDHYTGPAVFYNLRRLKPGAPVYVSDSDGNRLTFIVTELKTYRADDAPLDRIFGPSDKRRLNLITCAGTFDKKTQQSSHRLVVFTELAEPEASPTDPNADRPATSMQSEFHA